jgi:hypothetical protein
MPCFYLTFCLWRLKIYLYEPLYLLAQEGLSSDDFVGVPTGSVGTD